MKNIFLILFAFGLTACQALPPTPTVQLPIPTNTQSPTNTPVAISTATPKPLSTFTPTLIPMITFTPTITSTPLTKGMCPIDLSKPEVYIFAGYSPTHMGLDIAGPYGTPHISPDECAVDELYIGEAGNHGMLIICPKMNALYGIRKVGIGHLDFAYDDYNTLKWYGVSISTFFENEKPKKGLS